MNEFHALLAERTAPVHLHNVLSTQIFERRRANGSWSTTMGRSDSPSIMPISRGCRHLVSMDRNERPKTKNEGS